MVGSVRAGVIVALNTNERAPIFEHADVGLVGDWRETLPPLVAALDRKAAVKLHEHAWGPEDAPQVVCAHGVTGHSLRFRRLGEELLAGASASARSTSAATGAPAGTSRGRSRRTWTTSPRRPAARRTGSATASAAGSSWS